MTKDQLDKITDFLIDNVWRTDISFGTKSLVEDKDIDMLTYIVSSLHNLLYEEVTGERYDYAFHWCNKVGASTDDEFFDEMIGYKKEETK